MQLNTLQRVPAPKNRRELMHMAWTHGYSVPEYGSVWPLVWAVQSIRAQGGARRTADEFLLRCLNEPDFLIVVRLPYPGYYRTAGGVA